MEATELQQIFFTHLKSALPAHVSIADELCDLLGISADSAYRRLRGEKPLTLYEMKLICEKYHMSVDQLLQLQNDSILLQIISVDCWASYNTLIPLRKDKCSTCVRI